MTIKGCDVRHNPARRDTTTSRNHPRRGCGLVVVDLTRRLALVHYGDTDLPYGSTQRGPLAGADLDGSCGGTGEPLREEWATARRPEADLLPLTTWCWCSESPWPGLGTNREAPWPGPAGVAGGPDEGPIWRERLDKPRLRTGCYRDLSGPLWAASPGGRRAARGRRGWRVHFSWRARPMATRSSQPPESGGWRQHARIQPGWRDRDGRTA